MKTIAISYQVRTRALDKDGDPLGFPWQGPTFKDREAAIQRAEEMVDLYRNARLPDGTEMYPIAGQNGDYTIQLGNGNYMEIYWVNITTEERRA